MLSVWYEFLRDDPGSSSCNCHSQGGGAGTVLCTIFIHALALSATVNFFRRETRRGHARIQYLIDFSIVVLVMSFAFVAHMIEFALWALLFMICGEFREFGNPHYFVLSE